MPLMMQNHSSPSPIQVLVVDDSAVVRQVMQAILSQNLIWRLLLPPIPDCDAKMKQMRPHVVVLDLEMPRMDGSPFFVRSWLKIRFPHWYVRESLHEARRTLFWP